MKILSVSLCLATAVCVAAQNTPQNTPQQGQSYFALALQRDVADDTVTEFEYRGDILAHFNRGGFAAQAPPIIGDICNILPQYAISLIPTLDQANNLLTSIDIPAPLKTIITIAIDKIKQTLNAIGSEVVGSTAFGAVATTLTVIISALKPLGKIPVIGTAVKQAVTILKPLRDSVLGVLACTTTKLQIEASSCGILADTYRQAVQTITQAFPGANDANNEELKNLISASVAVLGIMDQYSIANSNDQLLSTRPIFSSSLLDQYRQEIIQKADSEDLKQFAQVELAFLVSISNALEACLQVAADPDTAAEEFAEEYDSLLDEQNED
ncbi:hypothetical protein FBU30_004092 [Linnemannia zychae]|nr:hypothetical protein FBU30_004092 [Linnemannia zychae]